MFFYFQAPKQLKHVTLQYFLSITGELIGVQYLYSQTGETLEDFTLNPDGEEAKQLEPDDSGDDSDVDEGYKDIEVDDLTAPPAFLDKLPSRRALGRTTLPSPRPKTSLSFTQHKASMSSSKPEPKQPTTPKLEHQDSDTDEVSTVNKLGTLKGYFMSSFIKFYNRKLINLLQLHFLP